MFLAQPTFITIRTNFNVGMVEEVVLSAFQISGRGTPHACGELATLARVASAIKLKRLEALLHLFRDYVPALF